MSSISSLGSMDISSLRQSMFKKMDANSDGTISKDEFVNARPEDVSESQASALYEAMDSSGTGALTEDQLAAGMEANRPEGDTSSLNSRLSSEIVSLLLELSQQSSTEETSETASATDTNSAIENLLADLNELIDSLGASTASNDEDNRFAEMDTDGDGVVSKDEFVAARPDDVSEEQAAALFDSIDTEGSGSVTLAQLEESLPPGGPAGPGGPPPMELTEEDEDDTTVSAASSNFSSESVDQLLAELLAAVKTYAANNGLTSGTSTSSISATA